MTGNREASAVPAIAFQADLTCARAPCKSCPYRRDVPAGVWAASEYRKLRDYDQPLPFQPQAAFFCHQNDGKLCAGWIGSHGPDNLLALRLHRPWRIDPAVAHYESPVPLFVSGAEAAAHGIAGIKDPDAKARRVIERLTRAKAARKAAGRRRSRP